jgi:hypothetical protein
MPGLLGYTADFGMVLSLVGMKIAEMRVMLRSTNQCRANVDSVLYFFAKRLRLRE